jgi:alpha-L-rhamnosidase
MSATRIQLEGDPYADRAENGFWVTRGVWPCSWICCPDAGEPPVVTAYRRAFGLDQPAHIRIHVCADERYDLFLDGERVGRGSERGSPDLWFFETYDLDLQPGQHTLVARIWSLGAQAPGAQMSVYHGFLCSPQAEPYISLLGTGVADWETKRLAGYSFHDIDIPGHYFAVGANLIVGGSQFAWGFERGLGAGWRPARVRDRGADARTRVEFAPLHLLVPAMLPAMLERAQPSGSVQFVGRAADDNANAGPIRLHDQAAAHIQAWNELIRADQPVVIPPDTTRRVLIDLENYYCAYPELVVSGGAGSTIRVSWAEALFNEPEGRTKGNRDEIDGKYFLGLGDTFLPDGGEQRQYETLWWRCGRYVELMVVTTGAPLTIEQFRLRETRYPLEMQSTFAASDARLEDVVPIAVRALQMCAHETYIDCPYYEQLMYVGDTRLEALATYAITRDDRLPRKALHVFDASRLPSGLTQSRYPSRIRQIIPPFSLWWVAMIYDYALWRGDRAFVQSLMPGARGVLDYFGR